MPNHVTNRLRIRGPRETVLGLVDFVKGESPFDFNKFIPMPDEVKVGERWYDWARHNWGTKWNAYSLEAALGMESPLELLAASQDEEAELEVEYEFDTAWSPPEPIIEAIVTRFPTLTFHYDAIEEQPSWGCSREYFGGEQVGGRDEEGDEEAIWNLSEWHAEHRWDEDDWPGGRY